MLLRASSETAGMSAKLEGAIGQGDGGVPQGAELIRFGEAASRLRAGAGKRAVAHATTGPCLQNNLVAVLERD